MSGESGTADASAERGETNAEDLPNLLTAVGEGVEALKRAVVEDESADVLALADDLWAVVDELADVLRTVEFERLPEAIDVEELPDAVEVEDIPQGLLDEDETAVDLTDLRQAVDMRELWEAVDLLAFREEKGELDEELAEFGADDEGGEGDEDGLIDVENVVSADGVDAQFDAEARQAAIEDKLLDAVDAFRSALLSTHRGLRRIYEANRRNLGGHDSLNPTAARTMPAGPLPTSASTRVSTVPRRVKYSRSRSPRRIYGRRFAEETDRGDEREPDRATADTADGEVADDDGHDDGTASADAEAEEVTES